MNINDRIYAKGMTMSKDNKQTVTVDDMQLGSGLES